MFPRNDLSLGRLAADSPCADAIVFARCVPLAQSAGQALCSCTLGACVCINRYPSPSGRPDLFRVRPFSHYWLRRTHAEAGCRVGLRFHVFAHICVVARTRYLIGGGATKSSNSGFRPEWSLFRPLRAACRVVASTRTVRAEALQVVRHLARLRKTILRPAPSLAVALAPLRATQVCATDKPALTVRGWGLSELKAIGAKAPGVFAFA